MNLPQTYMRNNWLEHYIGNYKGLCKVKQCRNMKSEQQKDLEIIGFELN